MQTINVGDVLTCAETGKQFMARPDGCSFNYCRTRAGDVLCDEGAVIRERRALLDRSRPFTGYLSADGKRLTTWKGATLGDVLYINERAGRGLSGLTHIRVRDVHGAMWYGKGAGRGMWVTVRPCKA